MAWPSIVGAVVGTVGLISSFIGSKKASKAAKEQSELEAEHERMITAERQRQINKEERALYGETLAGYAGGGILIGQPGQTRRSTPQGSVGSVTQEQATEFGFERAITGKVGASKVQQGLARGRAVADAYKYQGYANVATGISNILMNWTKG
jgi:hypothetical protein